MTTRYGQLMGRLGGQLAQSREPVPVRVYDGKPPRVPPGTVALWAENDCAWAQMEETRAIVNAVEIIELLLTMSRMDGLDVEA